MFFWEVVVAQLVEKSFPTPEVHGSKPVIGNFFIGYFFVYNQLYLKDENKEKEVGNGPICSVRMTFKRLSHFRVKSPSKDHLNPFVEPPSLSSWKRKTSFEIGPPKLMTEPKRTFRRHSPHTSQTRVRIPAPYTGWTWQFSHWFVVKIVLFGWKDRKQTKKRPGLAH